MDCYSDGLQGWQGSFSNLWEVFGAALMVSIRCPSLPGPATESTLSCQQRETTNTSGISGGAFCPLLPNVSGYLVSRFPNANWDHWIFDPFQRLIGCLSTLYSSQFKLSVLLTTPISLRCMFFNCVLIHALTSVKITDYVRSLFPFLLILSCNTWLYLLCVYSCV